MSEAYPTAITGTWDDLERHARYVYENADEQTTDWEFAEAVLVLLGHEFEVRTQAALGASETVPHTRAGEGTNP